MQRGKGGVYEALDLSVSPPRRVILKEGRRHGETDWLGIDGYARLKHEARVLRSLAKAGLPVPQIFREFSQNGNRYLVLERITGRPLIAPAREQPRQFSWRRAEKILRQLEPVLSRLHAAGWVWRDCKPSHIFVHRGEVRLIDFEEAGRIRGQNRLAWRSKNYCLPNNQKSRISVREDDYALGVIAFQFGTGKFPPASARSRAALYQRTKCPGALREKIEQLLTAKIARRLVK
jgi:serine/threonine protein kinase